MKKTKRIQRKVKQKIAPIANLRNYQNCKWSSPIETTTFKLSYMTAFWCVFFDIQNFFFNIKVKKKFLAKKGEVKDFSFVPLLIRKNWEESWRWEMRRLRVSRSLLGAIQIICDTFLALLWPPGPPWDKCNLTF